MSRREFMRRALGLGLSAAAAAALFSAFACRQANLTTSVSREKEGQAKPASPADSSSYLAAYPYLAVARGKGPSDITQAAVNALGGMGRFIKPGDDVILKPNICVGYRSYEYAATTNPEVVGTVTRLCREAGARRIRVMDSPFSGTAAGAYNQSGIEGAVKAAGGEMEIMSSVKYRDVAVPAGKAIKSWPVYGEILDADVLINLPIAKQHGSAGLTLGMKNLLGIVKNPNQFHLRGLHQCIVDLNSALHPTLTIVDAVRILTRGGPTGGNLNDVKMTNTVIASTDIVAADAYAATLFGLQGSDIEYIRKAAELGLGSMDMDSIMIKEIDV
jgi:uncharacterized protein (DUF362 family)